MDAPSTTTAAPPVPKRLEGDEGHTSATPTIYIGSEANFHAYRADDGDLHVDIASSETGAHVASIRLTSDKAEAAFLAAITAVTA